MKQDTDTYALRKENSSNFKSYKEQLDLGI